MVRMIFTFIVLSQHIRIFYTIRLEENGKFLNNNYGDENLSRRRRPSSGGSSGCNFNGGKGGRYKTDGTGRTFFDLAFLNVGYNYQYNINCGEPGSHNNEDGGFSGHNKPGLGGHKPGLGGHKPGLGGHKPGLGGHKPLFGTGGHKPGLGGHNPTGDSDTENQGFLSNRPILSMILGNKPLQGLFSQTSSQSGIFGDVVSSITGLLPTPQQFGQGLGDGISSFVQTLPQIGQSFQSLLPNFGDFQLPSFPTLPQGGQGGIPSRPITPRPTPAPPFVPLPAPVPTTVFPNPDVGPDPVDPDDIIYSDESRPVHEDHDLVTDPYNNRLRPGYGYRQYYNLLKQNALNQMKYQRYGNYKREGHGFHYDSGSVQNDSPSLHRYNKNQLSIHEQRNYSPPDPYRYQGHIIESRNSNEGTRRQLGRPFKFPS